MSKDKAREKAMRYCAFQERCQLDVLNRLKAWNVEEKNWDEILDYLIDENFLNEQRYVEGFIRGKFRIKKWGRNKIKMGLIAKRAYEESRFTRIFETEINPEEYQETLIELMNKKSLLIQEEDIYKKKDKLYRYLTGKGFESEHVYNALSHLGN